MVSCNGEANGLHYRLDGPEDAPVVMLSNSLGTGMDMWAPQLPELARQFRVLRYDTRGHGGSVVSPGPYTVGGLAADALSVLDVLDLDRVHFCGLSLGGMVGQWLGVHAADRVASLTLCNTAAYIGPASLWDQRIAKVREGGMAAIADGVLTRWFTPSFLKSRAAVVAPLREGLVDTPAEGYAACCAAVRDMDDRELVAQVGVPTLIISGSQDEATPPADGRFLAECIPGADYRELDAAHLSNVEQAPAFTSLLLDFLHERAASETRTGHANPATPRNSPDNPQSKAEVP